MASDPPSFAIQVIQGRWFMFLASLLINAASGSLYVFSSPPLLPSTWFLDPGASEALFPDQIESAAIMEYLLDGSDYKEKDIHGSEKDPPGGYEGRCCYGQQGEPTRPHHPRRHPLDQGHRSHQGQDQEQHTLPLCVSRSFAEAFLFLVLLLPLCGAANVMYDHRALVIDGAHLVLISGSIY